MPTKIMYLVDHYDGPQAGTEGQLLQLVQHLDRSRYEPSMTLLRKSEYIERNLFPCPVSVLGISKLASMWTIFRIIGYARKLRRENYRLVHCFFNDSALLAPPVLRLFGIRVLASRRDMGFWYTPRNLVLLRLISPFVARYIANSHAVKRLVQQREHVPSYKITVIYNGYAAPDACNGGHRVAPRLHEVPVGVPLVGIVANLKRIKRIDMLIEAFAIASSRCGDAHLIIIGDTSSKELGSTLGDLEALASRLGVRDRVTFTGRIEDPKSYVEKLTVAVLCSESEGFSNALIEYMQAGRPVVCTDAGGNPELVEDGRNGFLVPVGDIDALADRLVRLLSDRSLARRLGEAGYETAGSYSHARMVTEQMACYDEVLSGKRGCVGARAATARGAEQ